MQVLVFGATGVLGRAVVARLVREGHSVSAVARTPEKLVMADRMGAAAVRGDILDSNGTTRIVAEAHADSVVNLATAIPLRLKIDPKDWLQNDRIRTEGTRNLVRACEAAKTPLFVQESVGYVCAPRGIDWIDEESPRSTHAFLKATVAMEDIVLASAVPGVILRFGALMSADAWHTQQSIAALRRGMLPIVGGGESYISLIHADDAAAAVALTLANSGPAAGQTFNVSDNEPAPMAEVFPFTAKLMRSPAPPKVPAFVAKMAVGSLTLEILTASYRMANAKIRRTLGFEPLFPTYRETWKEIVAASAGREFTFSEDRS